MNNSKEFEIQINELKKNAKLIDMKIKELEEIQIRNLEIEDLEKNIMYSLINKHKPSLIVKTDFYIDYDKPRRSGIQKIQLKWTNDEYEFSDYDNELEVDTEENEIIPKINDIISLTTDDYQIHLKYFDEFLNNYKNNIN